MENSNFLPITIKMLASIENGKLSKKELLNVHNNYQKEDVPDEDRELISSSVEKLLRVKFPAAANKIFGAKDSEARDMLGKVLSPIEVEFDLSNNKHKNGIKTGGNVISGEVFLYTYISYKNSTGFAAHFALSQPDVDDELRVLVSMQQVGKHNAGIIDKHELGVEEFSQAQQIYRSYLRQIVDE